MGLGFGQLRVGGNHANRGVAASQHGAGLFASQQGIARADEALSIAAASARQQLTGKRVEHIAQSVAGNDGAHSHAIHREAGCANATLHGAIQTKDFTDDGASSGSHTALCNALGADT